MFLLFGLPFIYALYIFLKKELKRYIKYYKIKKWRKRHKILLGDRDYIYTPFKVKSIYPEQKIDFNTFQNLIRNKK
jgi:hypothetical protein